MTRAEQRANEFYPELNEQDDVVAWHGFIAGYEQSEKDLALTIDDIERLHTFLYAVKNNKTGQFTFTRLSDEQYQEVLNRFNKTRNG